MTNSIEDDAARWIARRASGGMTEKEEAAYRSWLAGDPRRAAAIAGQEAMLAGLDSRADALLADSFEEELHEAWNAAQAREAARRRLPSAAIAATLAVAAIAIVIALFVRPAPDAPSATRYATALGERRDIALEDGSLVTLNANTALHVTYTDDSRQLRLEKGEALFDVASDKSRPFTVETRLGAAVAVGTAFSVELSPDAMRVGVVEGVVQVSDEMRAKAALIDAGRGVVVDADGVEPATAFDAARELAWREGRAIFVDADIESVVDDLNRYFDKPIVIAAPDLETVRVTGEFDIDDPQAAASALAFAFGAEVRATPAALLLVKRHRSGE